MTFAEAIPLLLIGQSIKRPGMMFYKAKWAKINLNYETLSLDEEAYALNRADLEATDWEVVE